MVIKFQNGLIWKKGYLELFSHFCHHQGKNNTKSLQNPHKFSSYVCICQIYIYFFLSIMSLFLFLFVCCLIFVSSIIQQLQSDKVDYQRVAYWVPSMGLIETLNMLNGKNAFIMFIVKKKSTKIFIVWISGKHDEKSHYVFSWFFPNVTLHSELNVHVDSGNGKLTLLTKLFRRSQTL